METGVIYGFMEIVAVNTKWPCSGPGGRAGSSTNSTLQSVALRSKQIGVLNSMRDDLDADIPLLKQHQRECILGGSYLSLQRECMICLQRTCQKVRKSPEGGGGWSGHQMSYGLKSLKEDYVGEY